MNAFKDFQYLEKYLNDGTWQRLENAWREPHRAYHTVQHLEDVIRYISRNRWALDQVNYDTLLLAAFFHDVVYDTKGQKNNEDESIKRFLASFHGPELMRNAVVTVIEATKHRKRPTAPLVKLFWEADNDGFHKGFEHLLKNEALIRKEFKHVPKSIYKKKRKEFLKTNLGLFDRSVDEDIMRLMEWVEKNY